MKQRLKVLEVPVGPFSFVMSLIIPEPGSPFRQLYDSRVFYVIFNAGSNKLLIDVSLVDVERIGLADEIVLDEELQGILKRYAGGLVETIVVRSGCLIVEFRESWRDSADALGQFRR